jgi:hypothetical protein
MARRIVAEYANQLGRPSSNSAAAYIKAAIIYNSGRCSIRTLPSTLLQPVA